MQPSHSQVKQAENRETWPAVHYVPTARQTSYTRSIAVSVEGYEAVVYRIKIAGRQIVMYRPSWWATTLSTAFEFRHEGKIQGRSKFRYISCIFSPELSKTGKTMSVSLCIDILQQIDILDLHMLWLWHSASDRQSDVLIILVIGLKEQQVHEFTQ